MLYIGLPTHNNLIAAVRNYLAPDLSISWATQWKSSLLLCFWRFTSYHNVCLCMQQWLLKMDSVSPPPSPLQINFNLWSWWYFRSCWFCYRLPLLYYSCSCTVVVCMCGLWKWSNHGAISWHMVQPVFARINNSMYKLATVLSDCGGVFNVYLSSCNII